MNDMLNSANANYVESWKTIVHTHPNSDIREDDQHSGLFFVCSGSSVSLFNVAFITHQLSDPDGAVRKAIEYLRDRNLPGLICIRDGIDPRVDEAAQKHGLKQAPPHPGMILHPITPAEHSLKGLEITKVSSENLIDDFARIAETAFGMPAGLARQLTALSTLEKESVTYFLGRLDGKSIATCDH